MVSLLPTNDAYTLLFYGYSDFVLFFLHSEVILHCYSGVNAYCALRKLVSECY